VSGRTILRSGDLEAHLLPSVGGSLARFDRLAGGKRQPLLRGTDRDDGGPLEAACFPLVPFCNRIRGGEFSFRGESVRLTPNMPPDPSPLHGHGWLSPWDLETLGESEAEMRFTHRASEWPWDYEAVQLVSLDPAGLTVELSCRNLSARPMPCGLGLHPYYPCGPTTRLDAEVESVWTVDEQILPVALEPARGVYDLRARLICGQGLDNGFSGWSGTAVVDWAGEDVGLRLSSPDCRFFQVYSPVTGGLFVAEPVQNANAALNEPEEEWAELGIEVLQPGEQRRMSARYELMLH
jgi:aldose 1-epimerase